MPIKRDEDVPIRVRGTVLESSLKAWKFQATGRTNWHWLPKSQCQWHSEAGVMWVAAWLARDKGYDE